MLIHIYIYICRIFRLFSVRTKLKNEERNVCFRSKDFNQINSKYRREPTTNLKAHRTCCENNYTLQSSKMNTCVGAHERIKTTNSKE